MALTRIFRLFAGGLVVALLWACPSMPKPQPPTDPKIQTKPETEPVLDPENPGEYKVSTAKYDTTFQEIKTLILKLNEIIRKKDFDQWLPFLDPAYVKENGDPENLQKISESPILKKNGIRLRNLQDYFRSVVVPSRANASLDRIAFLDKELTRVVAYTKLDGNFFILYQLKLIDGQWKISHW